MLRHSIIRKCSRHFTTTTPSSRSIKNIPTLPDATIETFRSKAFEPALPFLLRGQFNDLPAITKWFTTETQNDLKTTATLNRKHLDEFGSTIVPLEIIYKGEFVRVEQPLSFFIESPPSATTSRNPESPQIYLAQADISTLPPKLVQDIPIPSLVSKAGKGDIYASSLWLGNPPTYTPLHKDPNPNLFVQLSGRKIIRMFSPKTGLSIFDAVQDRIGGQGVASMRGEEMMQGAERQALEEEVWGKEREGEEECWEGEVEVGDGLFIPKGWWHSVRSSSDEGMIGSLNWWFR